MVECEESILVAELDKIIRNVRTLLDICDDDTLLHVRLLFSKVYLLRLNNF